MDKVTRALVGIAIAMSLVMCIFPPWTWIETYEEPIPSADPTWIDRTSYSVWWLPPHKDAEPDWRTLLTRLGIIAITTCGIVIARRVYSGSRKRAVYWQSYWENDGNPNLSLPRPADAPSGLTTTLVRPVDRSSSADTSDLLRATIDADEDAS